MSVPLACSSSARNVYGHQKESSTAIISTRERRMIFKILLSLLVFWILRVITTTLLLPSLSLLCFLFGVISISARRRIGSRIQNLNLLLPSPSGSTRRRPRRTFLFLTLLTMVTTSSFTCLAIDVTFSARQNPFLVLCTVDGQILVLDAYDGTLQGGFSSGVPLVGASSSLKDNRRIVPGLDGSLYISDNVGFLQPLTISVVDVLQSPVKTCSSQQDCGIVTATKQTSLFALSSSTGQLVWHQNAQGETTTTTAADNENQSQPSSPTVLLQREDVLVQQISTDSGDQVWNVTLGTFQALEFGDQEMLQNSDPFLLPGGSLDSLDKWLALEGDRDQHNAPPARASHLPNVMFGPDGTSLTAVDPHRSGRVLWKREFETVVASVFGLSGKSWKPLTVLEEADDDDVEEDADDVPSSTASRKPWAHGTPRLHSRKHSSFQDAMAAQATGLAFYQPPPWQQVLYNQLNLERIFEHIGHLFSPFGARATRQNPLTKREDCLFPGVCSEERRLVEHFAKARETDLLKSLHRTPLRLELPSSPPQDMLHMQRTSEGLFLTWRLVLAIVITLVAFGGVAFRFLYVKKKQQWLQLIARATTPAHSSSSLSMSHTKSSNVSFDERGLTLSQSGATNTGTTINKKLLRRTQSLPDVQHDNSVGSLDLLSSSRKLLQHANTSEGKLIKTVQEQQADNNTRSITTTAAASSLAASGASHQEVGLIDGIPLVRYSRYNSEFDETVALGKGGFGTVFRCKNALDGREYAIKKVFIRHDQGYPKEFSQRLQRVLREVKILAQLDHANIVRYYTAWLELEQGVSGEKDASASAAASDYYMLQSTTTKNTHGQFSSEIVTSPNRCPAREQRRVSLDPWKATDPIGWNNSNNEDSLARMDHAPPIHWDDYGFTFDRSENNMHNNTDGSFASSTSDDQKDADASITNDGRRDFSSQGGGMETGENSIASETSWSQEDINTNVTCNKEPVTSPKELAALSSPATSMLVRHTLYIQMQLCSQKTLADFLSNEEARRGPSGGDGVDIPFALSLFLQISQGVKHVHGQGLIHRDLKPNNCFIDDTGVVKVGDFGLSRESTDKGNESTPSTPMSLGDGTDNTAGVGTRSYASPEQMSGSDYDSSTDVYSLGIILFELCYPMYTVRFFACP
jgi:serine/threonine protein kinase